MGSPTTDLQVAEGRSQGTVVTGTAGRVGEGSEPPIIDTAAVTGEDQGRQQLTGIEPPSSGTSQIDLHPLKARLEELHREELVLTLKGVHAELVDYGILTRKQLTEILEERLLVLKQSEEEVDRQFRRSLYRALAVAKQKEEEDRERKQEDFNRDIQYQQQETTQLELQVRRWELQKEAFQVQKEIVLIERNSQPTSAAAGERTEGSLPTASTATGSSAPNLDRTSGTTQQQGSSQEEAQQVQPRKAGAAPSYITGGAGFTAQTGAVRPPSGPAASNSRNYVSSYSKAGGRPSASSSTLTGEEESKKVTGTAEQQQDIEDIEISEGEEVDLEWPFKIEALNDFQHVKIPIGVPELIQRYFGLICDVIDIITARLYIFEVYEQSYGIDGDIIDRYSESSSEEREATELQIDTFAQAQYERCTRVRDPIEYHLPRIHPRHKPLRESHRLEQIYNSLQVLLTEIGKYRDQDLKAIDSIAAAADLLPYLPQPSDIQARLSDKLAQCYRNFLYIYKDPQRRRAEIDVTDVYRGVLQTYQEHQQTNEDLQVLALKLISPIRGLEEIFVDFTTFIGRNEFEVVGSWIRSNKPHVPHEYSNKLYYPSRKFITTLTGHGLTIRFAEDLSKPPTGKTFLNEQQFANHQLSLRDSAQTIVVLSVAGKPGSSARGQEQRIIAVPGGPSQLDTQSLPTPKKRSRRRSPTPPPRSPHRPRTSNWDRRDIQSSRFSGSQAIQHSGRERESQGRSIAGDSTPTNQSRDSSLDRPQRQQQRRRTGGDYSQSKSSREDHYSSSRRDRY